ncbi:MAG: carbohydrate ABC transporter permease [Propionibacteriaceae bacterium]
MLAIIAVIPLLAAIGLSFTSYDMINSPRWVGLNNYVDVLTTGLFWTTVQNTLTFAVGQLAVGLVVALAVSVLFDRRIYGGAAFRTLIYLPQAASYVAVALIWNLLLDPFAGPLDKLIKAMGGSTVYFLSDSSTAMLSIIVMSIWHNLGYFVLLLLAGLQSVPLELIDAAKVDGAGGFRRFIHVTVPSMSEVLAFVVITWFLWGLQMFTQAYVMTGGGPVNATRTVVYLMYDEAFTSLHIGTASAVAVMLFALVVGSSLVLRAALRGRGN